VPKLGAHPRNRRFAGKTLFFGTPQHGIGPARANRALVHCRIADTKTIAGLSNRQRAELIDLLQH
jgi:hypothetical protein